MCTAGKQRFVLASTKDIGFNGEMLENLFARGSGRVLIALICMGLGGAACEISSSADDRKARIEKLQEIERDNQRLAELEQEDRLMWQTFTSRFEGKIEPGVGCDVCPDLCERADLRAMEASAFQQAYRQAILQTQARDDLVSSVAILEHIRLICIARRAPAMRDALLPLLDAGESPDVRFEAAVDALKLGVGTSEPRRALYELGQGTSSRAVEARMVLDTWDADKWRSMTAQGNWY